MRILSAITCLSLCLPPVAYAQRGGARGGFAGHASVGSGFHGSVSGPTRAGMSTAPRFSSPLAMRSPYAGNVGLRGAPGYFFPRSSSGLRSPRVFSSGAYRLAPGQPRNVGAPRFYPRVRNPWLSPLYPYPGLYTYSFLDPFWGIDDSDFFLNGTGTSYSPADAYAYAGQGASSYPNPGGDPAGGYAGQPYGDGATQPGGDNGPLVYAPYGYPQLPQTADAGHSREDAVTLFFKDGRPPEQIRNYALTRSALLVTGGHMREIPLEQIDLVTTERVNDALGVEFRLPLEN